jgi:hypothetical protein
LNNKKKQHYALFRLQAGRTLRVLSTTSRGAAVTYLYKFYGIKIAALLGDIFARYEF